MDIKLSANLRYSQWTHGEDVDIHHLRDLRFEEEGDGGEWLGIDMLLDFRFHKNWSFLLGYSQNNYKEIKASMKVTDLITGDTTSYAGDSAGLDHSSGLLSLGMNYRF